MGKRHFEPSLWRGGFILVKMHSRTGWRLHAEANHNTKAALCGEDDIQGAQNTTAADDGLPFCGRCAYQMRRREEKFARARANG